MTDCISREAAIIALTPNDNLLRAVDSVQDGDFNRCRRAAIRVVANLPAADVRENKRGKWVLETEPDGKPYCFHCSACDDDFHYIGITTKYNFCPNCGAEMERDNAEES